MLLLYVESGAGSKALALAMQEKLNQKGQRCHLVSVSELIPQWLYQLLFGQYYEWCISGKQHQNKLFNSQWFYPLLYRLIPLLLWVRGNDKAQFARSVFKAQSHVIACSFYGAFFAKYFAKKFNYDIEIAGVLGDYQISNGWRTPVDRLFTSHQYTHPVIDWHIKRKTPIHAFGIPTQHQELTEKRISNDKGLSLLLCGGGWGLGIKVEHISELMRCSYVDSLAVICGHNKSILNEIKSRFSNEIQSGQLKVYGFVNNLNDHYASADIIITKAGGITLTEAALAQCCIIVNGALPGQEEHNLNTFKQAGAALHADNSSCLSRTVKHLADSSQFRQQMLERASHLVNANASERICKTILPHLF